MLCKIHQLKMKELFTSVYCEHCEAGSPKHTEPLDASDLMAPKDGIAIPAPYMKDIWSLTPSLNSSQDVTFLRILVRRLRCALLVSHIHEWSVVSDICAKCRMSKEAWEDTDVDN